MYFACTGKETDSESASENEIWEEDEDDIQYDIESKESKQPPKLSDQISFNSNAVAPVYAKCIIKFLLAMQAVFRFTDAAMGHILKFLKALFLIIG